jgi:hypothetical protein
LTASPDSYWETVDHPAGTGLLDLLIVEQILLPLKLSASVIAPE